MSNCGTVNCVGRVFLSMPPLYRTLYLFKSLITPALTDALLSSRCHQCASVCAVCHHVVKGLFVWCQGCNHGGHLEHIRNWLKSSAHCPAGCGHLCEYTWANHCSHSCCSVGGGVDPHTHTGQRDVFISPHWPGVSRLFGNKDDSNVWLKEEEVYMCFPGKPFKQIHIWIWAICI